MTLPSLEFSQPINRNCQIYRPLKDVYCEPGLITIMILSCGRHPITRTCLYSTIAALSDYSGPLEWIFLEQGWNIDVDSAEKNLAMYRELKFDRKIIIVPNQNYGINVAINQLYGLSRGEYTLLLECDWWCSLGHSNWLKHSKDILDQHSDIGVVQLRSIHDPNENWGYKKPEYSPWSCDDMSNVMIRSNYDGTKFLVATNKIAGVNNNPALWRKKMRRELGNMQEPELWSDLRHGETTYQEKFMKTKWFTAHIWYDVYYHRRI